MSSLSYEESRRNTKSCGILTKQKKTLILLLKTINEMEDERESLLSEKITVDRVMLI